MFSPQLCRQCRIATSGEIGDQLSVWFENGTCLRPSPLVDEEASPTSRCTERWERCILLGCDLDGAAKQGFDLLCTAALELGEHLGLCPDNLRQKEMRSIPR